MMNVGHDDDHCDDDDGDGDDDGDDDDDDDNDDALPILIAREWTKNGGCESRKG